MISLSSSLMSSAKLGRGALSLNTNVLMPRQSMPLQLPPERDRARAWLLAVIEAVSLGASLARLEPEPPRPALARPLLGLVEQLLSDPERPAPGMHGEVLDPYAPAEADRLDVLVRGAEPDVLAVEPRHEQR